MKFCGFQILALMAAAYAAQIEDDCGCTSEISGDQIKIRCQLPNTNNQTSIENPEVSQLPRDCYDIKHSDPLSTSGIYRIYPEFNRPQGFLVRCDQSTDGGGWIVAQNRQDGSEDFYLNWESYVDGFGSLEGEFWMGLQLLHELTRFNNFELRFDLSDFDDEKAYATYRKFSVGEGDGYVLNFDKNSYFGDAGDSLSEHYNMRFSTLDRDQDKIDESCAQNCVGAFWYNRCHGVNINGLYLNGTNDKYAQGVIWKEWKGYYYSLKTTQMKFRPVYIQN